MHAHIKEEMERFEKAFNTQHSDMVHVGNNAIRRRDCEICNQNKIDNPKGYYKTFLTEQKCYWNDEMFQDIKRFLLSSHLSLLEKYIEGLRGKMREVDTREIQKQFIGTIVGELNKTELEEMYEKNKSYNFALQSEIDYLQAEVEKIKKL